MLETSTFDQIFKLLPQIVSQHTPKHDLHQILKKITREKFLEIYDPEIGKIMLPHLGEIILPFFKMGAIDSTHLFDLDELILFNFYWLNRNRYKKVLDIGANLGLHSIVLSKCGLQVEAFEPDPIHFAQLEQNLKLNHVSTCITHNEAVSTKKGDLEFVRVLGNTTGSHLKGAKSDAYGELETFSVKVVAFKDLVQGVDLVKMDVEGHEAEILLATNKEDWSNLDALVEIQDEKNAHLVFNHLEACGVYIFSQKINWKKARQASDLPFGYKEGMVFISTKDQMPWS